MNQTSRGPRIFSGVSWLGFNLIFPWCQEKGALNLEVCLKIPPQVYLQMTQMMSISLSEASKAITSFSGVFQEFLRWWFREISHVCIKCSCIYYLWRRDKYIFYLTEISQRLCGQFRPVVLCYVSTHNDVYVLREFANTRHTISISFSWKTRTRLFLRATSIKPTPSLAWQHTSTHKKYLLCVPTAFDHISWSSSAQFQWWKGTRALLNWK